MRTLNRFGIDRVLVFWCGMNGSSIGFRERNLELSNQVLSVRVMAVTSSEEAALCIVNEPSGTTNRH